MYPTLPAVARIEGAPHVGPEPIKTDGSPLSEGEKHPQKMHVSTFKCQICLKKFTRKEHLQRHERLHNRERPFACDNCGKQFGRKDLLTRHVKSDSCGKADTDESLARKRKPPRCRVACQACIASKCRCVKNSESDSTCARCLKKNIECVTRSSILDTGDKVGKALRDALLDIDTPTLHNLLGSEHHDKTSKPGVEAPGATPGVEFPDPRVSPLSISALVTPYDGNLLMSGVSPAASAFGDSHPSKPHEMSMNVGQTTSPVIVLQSAAETNTIAAQDEAHNESTQPPSWAVSTQLTLHPIEQALAGDGQVQLQKPDTISSEGGKVSGSNGSTGGEVAEGADTVASKTNSDDIDYNLRKAFAYNSTGRQPSELDEEMNWINKFDLSGVQNLIRNVMDVANGTNDSSSDVLESYITSKKADFFSEMSIEKYFDQLLDFDSAFYDTTPLSDKAMSLYRGSPGQSPLDNRDSRSEAFVGSSLAWKKPSANASENEVKSVGNNEIDGLSILGAKIDRNSPKFRRFQILLKTRDSIMYHITEVHNGNFWKDRANVYLPSPDELTLLVIEYFERFHTRYHIVHFPTFNPNEVHALLLLAMLGAGAFFSESNNEALNKLGRYFFEIGRRKIILEFENNNSSIRDIQLQQANLIVFITASWSGIDRNVELSQSFTFTLATMTRRGDMFKQISYSTLEEIMEDQSLVTVEEKWNVWVYMESKKLLVYVLFYWCSQFSVIMNFPSFVNYSELELPLPHLEPFWRAASANDWLKLVESLKVQSPQQFLHHISFQLLIGPLLSSREYSGPSLSPKFFTDIIMGTLNATVRQFVTEQNERVAFTNSIPKILDVRKKKRRTMSLDATFHMTYLVNRQAEIENMLESLEAYVSNQSSRKQNLYKLEIEYSFVCLYSSIKDCMKLAGIDGEVESRQSIPRLLEWFKKDDSRLAIWHCAQILKLSQLAIANNICKLESRLQYLKNSYTNFTVLPFLPYLIFHSSLILWTFGLLINIISKFDRKKVITSLSNREEGVIIFLTDDWNSMTDKFIQTNDPIPCIRTYQPSGEQNPEPIFLSSPESILDFAIEINNSQNSGGYLTKDVSKLLRSLQKCSKDIISS